VYKISLFKSVPIQRVLPDLPVVKLAKGKEKWGQGGRNDKDGGSRKGKRMGVI